MDTTELAIQAGGHEGAFRNTKDGRLLKITNQGEISFYSTMNTKFGGINKDVLTAFVPNFHGIGNIKGRDCVIMRDLTHGMERPSVLDVKMGLTCIAPDADDEKKKSTIDKDNRTTTVSLGFRIVGGKIYKRGKDYETYDKEWSRTLTKDSMQGALAGFFHDGEKLRKDVVRHFLGYLKNLEDWFSTQHQIKLYSSSLLFVYDATENSVKAEVKMIDFAHVWPLKSDELDLGYLCGLKNLITYFQAILDSK